MTKLDRLREIYADLKERGIIRNKKDLAALIGYNYNSFTQAAKGDPTRLSDNLMDRLEKLYADPNLESYRKSRYGTTATPIQPAPASTQPAEQVRPGSIVVPPELVQMFSDLSTTIRNQQETIAAQTRIIDRLTTSLSGDSQTNVG